MNGPPPDGNGNIIDIFVLSSSRTLAPVLQEHLEQNGYHVTLFDDEHRLLETLKTGKPNLLVCDATDDDGKAYDLCRHIKADRDLFVIPVLVLTRGTDLSDLLFVLDCNADNFISFPYDLPYFTSLIRGMLDTPVERPTPEQIKTQFKIQHDDRIFVVTADRRKLLEFLLSSFEMAVSRQDEIADSKERIRLLEETVDTYGKEAQETSRTIQTLKDRLEEKEHGIAALRAEVSEKNRFLELKTRELSSLKTDLEKNRVSLAATQESLERTTRESAEAAQSYGAAIKEAEERAASLTCEVDSLTRDLSGTREELEKISGQYAAAETSLTDLRVQKDEADKAVVTRTREYNEMNAAFDREKARAVTAETGLKNALASKAEMEEELRRLIAEQEEIVTKQKTEIAEYQKRLEVAQSRIGELGQQVRTLAEEKEAARLAEENTHANLVSKTDHAALLEREIEETRGMLRLQESETVKSRAMLDEAEARCTGLKVQIDNLESGLERERSESAKKIDELLEKLAGIEVQYSAAAAKVEETETLLKSRNIDCTTVNRELEQAQKTIRNLTAELDGTKTALSEETLSGKSLREENRSLATEKDRIAAEAASLSQSILEARSALAGEREQYRASEERLNRIIREQASQLESLRGAHDDLRSDHDLHKNDLARARSDLDAASRAQNGLEQKISEGQEKIQILERDLKEVTASNTRSGQQIRSLSDELEQTRASLETERRLRRVAEDSLQSALAAHERSGQELGRLMTVKGSLDAAVEAERRLRQETELAAEEVRNDLALARKKLDEAGQQSAAFLEERDCQNRALAGELESARQNVQMLTDLVATLRREKESAESTASLLTTEIEDARRALADEWESHMAAHEQLVQARSALADEWEDHMAAHEQLVQARSALADEWEDHMAAHEQLVQARSALADEWEDHMTAHEQLVQAAGTQEQTRKESLAVAIKIPDLPTTTSPASPPMIPTGESADRAPEISSVEDLFEDVVAEENGSSKADAPLPGPDSAGTLADEPDEEGTEPSEGDGYSGNVTETPEFDETEDTDNSEGASSEIPERVPDKSRTPGMQPGISFNRSQWFDLLRWSHHSGALTQEQRMQIVRMGRLIQRGRRLTPKQEEQVVEMITLAQALGYRFMP